jgi:DNA-binding transcriptional LysR family regulator
MELRHLRYFVAVGEEQHFGRAASRLHIAQPPLSRQIQDLEKEMGFHLFDRLPRGVRLSAAGKLFLSDARRILQDVDEAKRRAERIALGKAGTLRIGIAMALSWHGMVVESFREFRRRQPDAELVLHHLISIHQIEAVLSGRLDAGFAAAVTPWNKDLAHWEFARDRILLAMPKGHRGGLGAPRIVQEASDRDTVLGLVQYGVGIAWLTESIRWHCPRGVVLLPVVDRKVRLPFNLIWKKDNSLPLLQKFVAQVQATKITPRN